MEDTNENDLSLLEQTLRKVTYLEDYISDKLYDSPMSSDITPITSDFDINMFKKILEEILEEIQKSLLISLERVKDFQGDKLDENWYNYKNYYQFETITKFLENEDVLSDNPTTRIDKMDYYQNLLGHLRTIRIKTIYHIWQLNMIIFSVYVKNQNNGRIIKKELIHYFKCDCLRIVFRIYSMGFNVDVGRRLGNNNVNEWGLFLDEYFSRNRKIIDNSRNPFDPNLFVPYNPLTL